MIESQIHTSLPQVPHVHLEDEVLDGKGEVDHLGLFVEGEAEEHGGAVDPIGEDSEVRPAERVAQHCGRLLQAHD